MSAATDNNSPVDVTCTRRVCLFGQPTDAENSVTLNDWRIRLNNENCSRWNFDFTAGLPVQRDTPTSPGVVRQQRHYRHNYHWTRIDGGSDVRVGLDSPAVTTVSCRPSFVNTNKLAESNCQQQQQQQRLSGLQSDRLVLHQFNSEPRTRSLTQNTASVAPSRMRLDCEPCVRDVTGRRRRVTSSVRVLKANPVSRQSHQITEYFTCCRKRLSKLTAPAITVEPTAKRRLNF